jgi:CheY-like chemotaxis protein
MNMNTSPQLTPNEQSIHGATMAIPLGLATSHVVGRKKILVVDDNMVVRKMVGMGLQKNGYEVLEAADGGTALGIVRTKKPDLILLDIFFPPDVAVGGGAAWDGFHIMEWLRRMDHARDVPIMMMTGSNPEEYRVRSLKAGAVAFFQKPVDQEELLAAVHRTFGEDDFRRGAS